MKNKKGFTLIELLVVVVIMTCILGIAIVSVNRISDSRKEQAYESVKDQIVTAAKEYFVNNEYFLKTLPLSSSRTGFVSLGTLVKEDYINVVTNPKGNKKIDMCSYVEVTAANTYKFVNNEADINALKERYPDCIMEEAEIQRVSYVKPVVVNTPAFTINLYKKNISSCENYGNKILSLGYNKNEDVVSQETDWYNKINAPNGLFLEIIDDNPSDNLTYVFKDENSALKCISDDGTHDIKIVAEDQLIDEQEYTIIVKLDRMPPTIVTSVDTSDWTNADRVYVNFSLTDSVSKVRIEDRHWNIHGLTQKQANSNDYKWSDDALEYNNGNNKVTENINKTQHTHLEYYSGQGYRKGKIQACDYADNCIWSEEHVAKIDRTPPNVAKVVSKNTEWTNKNVDYDMEMEDEMSGIKYYEKETNKTNLTYSESRSNTYKWNDDTGKYPQGYTNKFTNNNKGFGNEHTETGTFSKEHQGRRLIKIRVCDYAGLCTVSDATVAQIDTEPPKVIRKGSGYVYCVKSSGEGHNAHGFSVEYQDNLSGATLGIKEYYSSANCVNFYWANSEHSDSTDENNAKIYTEVIGCNNNPDPAIRFTFVDAAGNRYKNSKGNYYYGINHSEGKISSTNTKKCDSTKWYNESPNR